MTCKLITRFTRITEFLQRRSGFTLEHRTQRKWELRWVAIKPTPQLVLQRSCRPEAGPILLCLFCQSFLNLCCKVSMTHRQKISFRSLWMEDDKCLLALSDIRPATLSLCLWWVGLEISHKLHNLCVSLERSRTNRGSVVSHWNRTAVSYAVKRENTELTTEYSNLKIAGLTQKVSMTSCCLLHTCTWTFLFQHYPTDSLQISHHVLPTVVILRTLKALYLT